TKIIAVGLNYFEHANEVQMKIPDEPLIFMKPPSTLIAHNDNIIYPTAIILVGTQGGKKVISDKEYTFSVFL
ncbi:unnamed protein product, partial [marine sediment metagenome]